MAKLSNAPDVGSGEAAAPTFYEAKAEAWQMPQRQLRRVERRLRRRSDTLDAGDLTRWYAFRHVLREQGVALPPVTRRLP